MKQEEMTTQRMIGSTLLEYTYSLACLLWYHSNNANILNYNNRNITFYKRLLVKNVFFSAEEINAQELMNQLNAFIRLFFLLFFLNRICSRSTKMKCGTFWKFVGWDWKRLIYTRTEKKCWLYYIVNIIQFYDPLIYHNYNN